MDKALAEMAAGLQNGAGHRYRQVQEHGSLSALVLKYKDQLYAYENRCPHLGIELDWLPGDFFDQQQAFLVCSTHGALFQPDTGKCVSGPCQGQSLRRIEIDL